MDQFKNGPNRICWRHFKTVLGSTLHEYFVPDVGSSIMGPISSDYQRVFYALEKPHVIWRFQGA